MNENLNNNLENNQNDFSNNNSNKSSVIKKKLTFIIIAITILAIIVLMILFIIKYVNKDNDDKDANNKTEACTINLTLDEYNNGRLNIIYSLCKDYNDLNRNLIMNITGIKLDGVEIKVKIVQKDSDFAFPDLELYVNENKIELTDNNILFISTIYVFQNNSMVVEGRNSTAGPTQNLLIINSEGSKTDFSLYDLYQTELINIKIENENIYVEAWYSYDHPNLIKCDEIPSSETSNTLLMKEGIVSYENGSFVNTITKITYIKDICGN